MDQMITMHAHLRDRAGWWSRSLTIGILVASTVSVALGFSGADMEISFLGIHASGTTWLGWLGVIVFIASLIDLVLDRRGVANQHADAVGRLSELKLEYRDALQKSATHADAAVALEDLNERYRNVMSTITPIPDAEFNRLKARHLKKVEISKLLSRHPGETVRGAKKRLKKRLEQQKSLPHDGQPEHPAQ
ncbi:hypothetical protein ABDK96_15785 [Citricoccus nitrophenolicus]|uniref:Uncharacterized protein n=1 Tax=Citricoccus nitrophenolicus TaxID=863575 RepID=A0ABV0INF9_9MICC